MHALDLGSYETLSGFWFLEQSRAIVQFWELTSHMLKSQKKEPQQSSQAALKKSANVNNFSQWNHQDLKSGPIRDTDVWGILHGCLMTRPRLRVGVPDTKEEWCRKGALWEHYSCSVGVQDIIWAEPAVLDNFEEFLLGPPVFATRISKKCRNHPKPLPTSYCVCLQYVFW